MTKQKRKKTLVQRQQEIFVETNKLTLIGLRSKSAMLDRAMELERTRQPGRYVA